MNKPRIPVASNHLNTNLRLGPPIRRAALWLGAVTLLASASIASAQTNPDYWTDLSTDNTWTNANNWTDNLVPAPTSDVVFIDNGASGVATTGPTGTPDNIVNTNFTIQSLYNRTTNFTAHTTLIDPGIMLTITGAGTYAIFSGTLFDTSANKSEYLTINGPGAILTVSNLNGSISARQGEATSTATATIDLRGLDTLIATVTNVLAGGENTGRDCGVIDFAKTNYIICTAPSNTPGLIVGNNNTSSSKSPAASLLGLTNGFFSDGGIAVPQDRMNNTLKFNTSNSTAYFRNKAGTGRQNQWSIGWENTSGTGTSCNGTVDFSLGTVDAMIGTLIVGAGETGGTSTGNGTGILTFAGGSINANTVEIGQQMADTASVATGTINVSAVNAPATFTVNSNLYMGVYVGGSSPSATLNISSGAAATIMGNVVAGTGSENTKITVLGASLYLGGTLGASGTSSGPLGTLQLSNSTLTINLGLSPNPANPICTVNTFDGLTNCTLDIEGGAISSGQFTVIKYNSIQDAGFSAFTTLTLPSQAQGYLSNNVANNSIDLVVTNVFSPIWNGTHNGNWDINTSANWKTRGGAALTYEQTTIPGNLVTFDDTATGITNINLVPTNLAPSSINVSNSVLNYTFTGSGQLTGPGGLAKNGSGALVIANTGTNSFLGSIGINGGLLQLGVSNGLPSTGNITLADVTGATFDLNNFNQTIASLSGGGSDGGGNVTLGTGTLTISGSGGNYNGFISGNGGLVMAGGSQVFNQPNSYTSNTLISGGTLIVANNSGSATGSGGLDVEGTGVLQFGVNSTGANGSVSASVITNNGQVAFDCYDNTTLSALIIGTGGLVQEGSGLLIIQTPNSSLAVR
jgi:fibronectin-binding autotransporter adhesin